ncbi:LOW QUALITY PROTEIN: glandular kallikrein-like, partial [Chlamydotis macqueenii]
MGVSVPPPPTPPPAPPARPWAERILGGSECPPRAHPGLVLLFHFEQPQCGGALLSPRWVLTAAHCRASHIQVRAGEHGLAAPTGREQFAVAVEAVTHTGYREGEAGGYAHDLMLLRVEPPFVPGAYVRPLALPPAPPPAGARLHRHGLGDHQQPPG